MNIELSIRICENYQGVRNVTSVSRQHTLNIFITYCHISVCNLTRKLLDILIIVLNFYFKLKIIEY